MQKNENDTRNQDKSQDRSQEKPLEVLEDLTRLPVTEKQKRAYQELLKNYSGLL